MTRLSMLGRLLPVLGLVAVTIGLGASSADAQGFARACKHPEWVTSDPDGRQLRSVGTTTPHNNMWNAGGYDVSQTMSVCSPGNWSVSAKADNNSHDGAVKTYPNVHRDYHDWGSGHEPRLSAFASITSKFASRSPHVGIYNGAYDIWINGVADSGSTELMIWTDNHRPGPRRAGSSRRAWSSRVARGSSGRPTTTATSRSCRTSRSGTASMALKKRFAYLTTPRLPAPGVDAGSGLLRLRDRVDGRALPQVQDRPLQRHVLPEVTLGPSPVRTARLVPAPGRRGRRRSPAGRRRPLRRRTSTGSSAPACSGSRRRRCSTAGRS